MNMSGGSVVWILDADSGKFTQAMIQAERQADQTGRNVDRSLSRGAENATNALSQLGKTIGGFAFNAFQTGAAGIATALVGLGGFGVSAANNLQSLQLSMNGLTKSMELGRKAMAGAYEYAQTSPFQTVQTAAATKTLIAFGMSVDDAIANLKTLGNISITSGVPIEAMAGIFGRVSAQGRLMGGDIQQLTENGVAILPQLQKQLGKTATEVRDMASAGEIDFATFRKAMGDLVDPTILEQLNNTLPRQLDRLQGSVRQMAFALIGASVDATNGFSLLEHSIGQSVVNITKILADGLRTDQIKKPLADLGNAILPAFEYLEKVLPSIISGIGTMLSKLSTFGPLLLPVIGAALSGFGGLFAQIPILGELLGGFAGPIGVILGLFGALVAYSPELRQGIGEAFKIIGQTLQELKPVFSEIVNSFKESSQAIGTALKPVVIALAEAFSAVLKALAPIIPILSESLVTAVVALAPALVLVANAIATVANAFSSLDPNVQAFIVNALLIGVTVGTLASKFKPVTDAMGKFSGIFGKLFGGKMGGASAGVGNVIGSTIEAIFKPLANPTVLKGAAGAGLIGLALAAVTFGINEASKVKINIGNLGIVVASIAVLTLIFTLLGKLGPSAIIGGIAAAAIGAGLWVAAWGISNASKMGNDIQIGGLAIMVASLVVVGAILAVLAPFAGFAAIGAIASAVIGGGLLVAAIALVEVSKIAPTIRTKAIEEFAKTIAVVSLILGSVALWSAFGAITSIANMIIAGGLLVSAIALVKVSQLAASIVPSNIDKLMDIIVKTNLILAALSAFSVFSAIGSLINSVITQGVLVAAVKLRQASEIAGGIQPYNMQALHDALKWVAKLETGGIMDNLKSLASTSILTQVAEQVRTVVSTLNSTGTVNVDKVQKLNDVMKKLSDMKTNGVFEAVKDMVSSGALVKVADNVKSIVDTFSNLKPVSVDSVSKLNSMMNELSKIKLEGGIFFDNRGEKAELLANVASKMNSIAKSLSSMPAINGNVSKNIQAVRDAIYQIGQVNEVGNIQNKEQIVGYSQSIVNKMVGLAQTINSMVSVGGNTAQKIQGIRDAIYQIGQINEVGGIANKEWIVGMSQSILNKMTGFATTLNNMVSLGGNSLSKIQGVRDAIYNIGQINEVSNMANKEWIVGMAQSVLNKMTGMASTLNNMVSISGNGLQKISDVRGAIYQLGQINEVQNMSVKELIVGQAQSILNKMSGMVQTMNAMPLVSPEALGKIATIRNAIYQIGQINQVEGMENKVFVVGQSQAILTSMATFANTLNTLPLVTPEKLTAMYTIRGAIYQAAQINQNVGDIASKVMIVGQAVQILKGLITFAQTLATLPDAGGKAGLLGALISGVNQVATTITASAPQFQTAGTSLINALVAGINGGRGALMAAGTGIQGAFWSAIQSKMGDEFNQGRALAQQVINGIQSVTGSGAYQAGGALQGAFWRGIQDKFGDEYSQGRALVQQVINGANSNIGGAYSVGANAAQGFINGANSRSAYSAGVSMASSFLQGLKDRGKQGSPWKTTVEIGDFAGQGLIEGIKGQESSILRAANSVVDNLLGVFDVGTVGINPMLQVNGVNADIADVGSLSRTLGSFDYNGNEGSHIENHIGEIKIANEVDAENWLQKLTRDDEVTRGGMTSGVMA